MTLRILSTPLTGSSLARIAIAGEPNPEWFVSRPLSPRDWKSRSDEIRSSLLAGGWLDSLGPAFNATGAALDRLKRAAQSGFVVTAGQQPGLFGGPLYTWWKALSVIALADRLQEQTGLPVAPVFWAATDDSDLAEGSYTIISSGNHAERLEVTPSAGEGTALSEVQVGDLSSELARMTHAAGSAPNGSALEILRKSYAPGHTLGSAYLELLREILSPLGVAVLDASHDAVRSAAHPILRRALERAQEIEDALAQRVADLKAGGHSTQVKLVKGRSLVFNSKLGERQRIRIDQAKDALEESTPGSFGPNVLLRPIVERSIIPTVAYMGGPAEIAYFAQVTAVARALEVPAPLVVPRWSGVVIEPRVQRILDKHSLTVEDFRDPHAVETRMARESLPEGLTREIESLSNALTAGVKRLAAEGGDLAPAAVIEGLRRNITHRLERLQRRFAAGVKKRGTDGLRDAAIARSSLFPLGFPQERALNGIPFIARYGDELFDLVMEETRKHAATLA